jgi:hypothetical protein
MKKQKAPKDWNNQIISLEEYCVAKNWNVEYTNKKRKEYDYFSGAENLIVIRRDRRPEITFYIMLHEIGHMMLCQNRNMYRERYNAVFESFSKASLTHRVKTVEEELDAWKTGFKLAKRLKLYVNHRKFEQVKARCITSYMVWAVNRKLIKEKESITNGSSTNITGGTDINQSASKD